MSVVVVLALLISRMGFAFSPDEYQLRLQKLKTAQAQSAALLGGTYREKGMSLQAQEKPKSLYQVHGLLKNYLIPPGKILYGKLFTRLVVGGESAPAVIQLDDAQGGLSKIRLLGTASQSGTKGRLTVQINKLILKSGESINVQATVLDTAGAYGLEAEEFSGKALAVAGAVASGFISGAAASQQTQTTNMFGFSQPEPTGRNAIYQGLAQSAADQSKRLIDEATNQKPVLVVEGDTPLAVLIQEEVRL